MSADTLESINNCHSVIGTLQNVLVVDDHFPWLTAVSVCIREYGEQIKVTKAITEAEALKSLKQQSFDLLVLDIDLKEYGSGVNVAKYAASINPAPAMVVLSGNNAPEPSHELLNYGVKHFLHKPASPDELLQAITGALKAKQNLFTKRPPKPEF